MTGGPPVGWKAKAQAAKSEANSPPPWAEKQFDALKAALAAVETTSADEDKEGSGTGLKGTGTGGGGTEFGIGTGQTGGGTGSALKQGGTGRGGDREQPSKTGRPKPDKVVLWNGPRGPMVNVHAGGTAVALPLPRGENPNDTAKRVLDAVAKLTSTGKRLANGATETGFEGGHGGHVPTELERAEATKTDATLRAYPARIAMQAGSGAEVTPGWATTVTGARNDFDMILDWDAETFGFSNQVFARAQFMSYYWQLIDISKLNFDKAKGQTESQDDYDRRMRMAAVTSIAQNKDNAQHVSGMAGFKAGMSKAGEHAADELKADRPDFKLSDGPSGWTAKAGVMAVEGLSATWDLGKALVSEWIAKVTEPENRRQIPFGQPGEYLVRCLANPFEGKNFETGERSQRATSIAAFPVRVLDMDERAIQVNSAERLKIQHDQEELLKRKADLEKSPGDEAKKGEVEDLEQRVTAEQKSYAMSTPDKLASDLATMKNEKRALEKMVANRALSDKNKAKNPPVMGPEDLDGLHGEDLSVGIYTLKKAGMYASWQWEMRIDDLKKAIKEQEERSDKAEDYSGDLVRDTQLRPRVTFASEENGAIVQMSMMLGRAKGTTDLHPYWILMDVTSSDTAGQYKGKSSTQGAAGDELAINDAFQDFADKAAYGRGTIAIEIPGLPPSLAGIKVPQTMLMKPGPWERWKHRLDNIVEIASIVAP